MDAHCSNLNDKKFQFSEPVFFLSMSIKKLRKTIQYYVPSIAEIDMSSSGSGYERHLTNSLTTIEKEKNIEKKSKAKERNLSTLCTMTSPCLPPVNLFH